MFPVNVAVHVLGEVKGVTKVNVLPCKISIGNVVPGVVGMGFVVGV
jgi:hypothetical protein